MQDQTELYNAFRNGNLDEARTLLSDPQHLPDSIETFSNIMLLDSLLRKKAFDILNVFIDNNLIETDIYEYDKLDMSFFQKLFMILDSEEDSLEFVKGLMQKLSSINDAVSDVTLLGQAFISKAKPEIVKILIEGGCDVNVVNNAENSYLHQIASLYIPEAQLVQEYAKILIDNGADVDAKNIVDDTPLMVAISRNKKELAEILLKNGASANEQNKNGETPYYLATVNLLSLPFYELLKQYDTPDFEKKTKDGTAFFVEFLKRTNNGSGDANKLLAEMIEDGANLFMTSSYYGRDISGFDLVAEKPFDVFEAVVKASGIDVKHADNDGNTLLHKVCAYNVNYDQNAAKDTYRKTKLLLEMGADANATNNNDETPMMLASSDNLKSKTVELLLSKQ